MIKNDHAHAKGNDNRSHTNHPIGVFQKCGREGPSRQVPAQPANDLPAGYQRVHFDDQAGRIIRAEGYLQHWPN